METFLVLGGLVLAVVIGLRAFLRPPEEPRGQDRDELYRIAEALLQQSQATAHPLDLAGYPDFKNGVELLSRPAYSTAEVLDYAVGDNGIIACIALESLRVGKEQSGVRRRLLLHVGDLGGWLQYFVLRLLHERSRPSEPLVGRILARVNEPTWDNPYSLQTLREFLQLRMEGGEEPAFGADLESLDTERIEWLLRLLPRVDEERTRPLVAELERWRGTHADTAALKEIGTLWRSDHRATDPPLEHDALRTVVDTLLGELSGESARSVLLVGGSGVGKTAIVTVLGRKLQEQGWTIFETGHQELLAGMRYFGDLEERLKTLVQQLGRQQRMVWVVPDFHALAWAGRHQHGMSSVLDYILPFVERGEITVIGETTGEGYQRLVQAKPRCSTALQACRILPLPASATLDLGRQWSRQKLPGDGKSLVSEETLQEAWSLAQQFLGNKAAPGNLLQFLSLTWERLAPAGSAGPVEIQVDDLIVTLGQLTGLPASILDEREHLDLAGLRQLFERRVMGQREAVDCLVERVAMIKAGVTNPTQPLGVFLFAGPTGTGKTEIGKTLTEFLFGSAERLIRLDMSEFQEPASLTRIFGEPGGFDEGGALVDQIRQQPFSVILLDEFEKAHERVWDLFLQVFDDGRLTDRLGRVVNFRHCLVIMTSNIGSNLPSGLGVGFVDEAGSFSPQAVQRAVAKGFRKEFLNRIDRIVVFQPLARETMRKILHKELDDAFQRRGLRNRGWAVEWDESAIEFLLEQGFTVDLGARPLSRAVERYLLTPLALTIVNQQVPQGDQFLFVRREGDALTVNFIDPEAPPAEEMAQALDLEPAAPGSPGEGRRLERIILSPRGHSSEVETARVHFDRLWALVQEEHFQESKRAALARTSEPGFWDSPDRFSLLGRAEYLDRIESGLRGAGSLLRRLEGLAARASRALPRDLLGRLAQQLFLIRHACDDVREARSSDAFLLLEAGHEAGGGAAASNDFARRLGEMYRSWAAKRGMRGTVLEESGGAEASDAYSLLLAVSGYAALALLSPEEGLHVYEITNGKKQPAKRWVARVRVIAQPDVPERGRDALRRQARQVLSSAGAVTPEVVRHYRESPSPLVRDTRRGWRTGHFDRVLGGDFDLVG